MKFNGKTVAAYGTVNTPWAEEFAELCAKVSAMDAILENGSEIACSFDATKYDILLIGATPESGHRSICTTIPAAVAVNGLEFQVADEISFTKWMLAADGVTRTDGTGTLTYVYGAGYADVDEDYIANLEARIRELEEREPEGGTTENEPTDEKYFDIDYDGIVSLKPEYRADGNKNAELPERIIIPDVIDGTAVSGFQTSMFQSNLRVKEITIPDGVTAIPDFFCKYAYNLVAIHNTEQITKLGKQVVLTTQIKKAIFPNLKEVDVGALAQAMFMHTADIGNNITEIPYGMFRNCSLLSLVKGGGSVKTIGKEAFYYNRNLKNLPLLANVTSVGIGAFYNSRIQFDWESLKGKCNFSTAAYPTIDNTTDYWSGVNPTPCENPLVTKMSQVNPEWMNSTFGDSGIKYVDGCAIFAVLHIHSALSGKLYNHPDEFAEDLRAIDPSLVTYDKRPNSFTNVAPMLQALGYTEENGYALTTITADITQDIYQTLCDAVARGAYVYVRASGYVSSTGNFTPDSGHAVVLYGINSNKEMLVLDSATLHTVFKSVGVDDIFTYRMPFQNLTGSSSDFLIVEKE